MFRFFRNTRKSLIRENKLGQYFAYAFGEIVLVVIGILIAMFVNRVREQQLSDTRNRQLLKAVLNELENNVQTVDRTLIDYIRIDSIRRKALFSDVRPEDFESQYLEKLLQITLSRSAAPKNQAYTSLVQNTRDLPDEFKAVLTQLQDVQVVHDELNLDQEINISLWRQADEYLSLNYPWYSYVPDRAPLVKTELLGFMADDFIYKNLLRDRLSTQHNYISDLFWYRSAALETTRDIREILDSTPNNYQLQVNERYRHFIGEYDGAEIRPQGGNPSESVISGRYPTETFRIVESDSRLHFLQVRDSIVLTELLVLSDQVLIEANGIYWHLLPDGASGDTLLINGLFDNDIALVKRR